MPPQKNGIGAGLSIPRKTSVQHPQKNATALVTPDLKPDDALVREKHRQVHTMHVANRRAEARSGRNARIIGLAVALLAAITGTSIFAIMIVPGAVMMTAVSRCLASMPKAM
jgi:hypothetical protein